MRTRSKLSFLFAAALAGLGLASQAGAAPNVPFNGSGASQTVNVVTGQHVTFQFDLATASNTAAAGFQDFAYYTFNGTTTLLANENSATVANSDIYIGGFRRGFQTVDFVSSVTGPVTLGFGVVNVGDGNTGTALLLDNIRVAGSLIPNGDLQLFPDFKLFNITGNTTVPGNQGSVTAPDGDGAFGVIADTTLFGGAAPDSSIANLSSVTGAVTPTLGNLALAVNGGGSAVPLPAGMYIAPLGLILAGVYSRKLRRTAAC